MRNLGWVATRLGGLGWLCSIEVYITTTPLPFGLWPPQESRGAMLPSIIRGPPSAPSLSVPWVWTGLDGTGSHCNRFNGRGLSGDQDSHVRTARRPKPLQRIVPNHAPTILGLAGRFTWNEVGRGHGGAPHAV